MKRPALQNERVRVLRVSYGAKEIEMDLLPGLTSLTRRPRGSEVLYSEPLIECIGGRQRAKEEFSVPRYSVWPPCDKSLLTALLKALILGNFRTTVKR